MRFCDDSAEAGLNGEGLQELRGAHELAQGVDAEGVLGGGQPVEPWMDIVAFDEAVAGKYAVAGAVGSSVGHEDRLAVIEQQLGVSSHADAVVAEALEEDDGIRVGVVWSEEPGPEGDVVGGLGETSRKVTWCAAASSRAWMPSSEVRGRRRGWRVASHRKIPVSTVRLR
jgi:hypothetical protein